MAKAKILVVDDEQGLVDLVTEQLSLSGYEAIGAYAGREGLQKALATKPDLILLDIIMYDISGFEVLRVLRNNQATAYIPVIMMTGKGETDAILKAQELGITDYVIKPVVFNDLMPLLKKYIA